MNTFLQIHPADNMVVALQKLAKGTKIKLKEQEVELVDDVPAKHKFSLQTLKPGDEAYMYGVLVGKAVGNIAEGSLMTTKNLEHAASSFTLGRRKTEWHLPDVAKYRQRQFMGYHRANGTVGTANYWLVIPMVFCENRNVEVLKDAMTMTLGYDKGSYYRQFAQKLVSKVEQGASGNEILELTDQETTGQSTAVAPRVFVNIDGIKFLTHEMGCGGTRSDAQALCGLLAGYITHPNVAGATVLSLGCQNAQVSLLREEIQKRDPGFSKPLMVLEQQAEGSEKALMQKALKQTIAGLTEANKQTREAAPLSKLCIGLECGGSDGFSGISANPAIGHTSDLIVALGGKVILSEFPELCGVEQELSDRCMDETSALRFNTLMKTYNRRAEETGSGFYANPSPGNIRDGLITDAIKSAGAAKKGGSSPVVDVLDYPEMVTRPGLNLLCTPGNDVESTTAEVASGATIVLFTTGLGTPTGNPIAPVVKISTNTALYQKMQDIIDIDCGTIISGTETIEQAGERVLDYVIAAASGEITPKAVLLGQDDFIPWKRGVSL